MRAAEEKERRKEAKKEKQKKFRATWAPAGILASVVLTGFLNVAFVFPPTAQYMWALSRPSGNTCLLSVHYNTHAHEQLLKFPC